MSSASVHWFNSLIRFIASIPYFDSWIRFIDSIHCFRSNIVTNHRFYCVFVQTCLEKHWFYCVFAQSLWKSNGFSMLSLEHVKKALVLLCFRWNIVQNHLFYCVLYVNENKKAKKWKKRLFFQRKIFADDKTRCKNWLWWESSMNFNRSTDSRSKLFNDKPFVIIREEC